MSATNPSFYWLLEQYALQVADQFIDMVDPVTQSQMIDVIRKIDSSVAPDQLEINQLAVADQFEEPEWQQVLNQPTDQSLMHRRWLRSQAGQLMQRNKLRIHRLEDAVSKTQHMYEKIEMRVWLEPRRSQLLNWYESIIAMYSCQLAQASQTQQTYIAQLQQLKC